ncbi:MAG: DnaJ domain-containing protein [Desulfobulbus sp.]|nr:DnaJ domain-containing protein [Desulfobulbus sp.]
MTMFGVSAEQLATMKKKDLTRIYRQKAHELHPDKGGNTEQFIRLTAAYEELLPSLR